MTSPADPDAWPVVVRGDKGDWEGLVLQGQGSAASCTSCRSCSHITAGPPTGRRSTASSSRVQKMQSPIPLG